MVCANCGKEMIKVGELTEQERNDWMFIKTKDNTTAQAMNPDTIKGMEFSDGQVYEYFKACFEARAESEFLKFTFFRDLRIRLNLMDEKDIWLNDDTSGVGVYIHPEE